MWTQEDFQNEVCLQPPLPPEVDKGLTAEEIARLVYRAIWFLEGERKEMARKELDRLLIGIGSEAYEKKYGGENGETD